MYAPTGLTSPSVYTSTPFLPAFVKGLGNSSDCGGVVFFVLLLLCGVRVPEGKRKERLSLSHRVFL